MIIVSVDLDGTAAKALPVFPKLTVTLHRFSLKPQIIVMLDSNCVQMYGNNMHNHVMDYLIIPIMAVCLCYLFLVCITSAVDAPPPEYHIIVAEQRRVALEATLAENQKVIEKPCLIVILFTK